MRTVLVVLACAAFAGCDDTLFGISAEPISETGYAGVQAVAEGRCISCHSAQTAQGALDLETDLHNATVGVGSSKVATLVLVQPGDPDNSLLYQLAIGQAPGEFGQPDMPPGTGGIPEDEAQIIHDWIADGAPDQ
jgi:hypothetical protein